MLTKSIAIIDDERDLANLFREALEMDGLQVCAFTDPIEAFNQLQHTLEGYAVIVSDYTMPLMNGVELCTKLLALNPKLKIIIISAYQDIEYNTSRFMFLHKPITIAHLLKAVKEYLTE